MNALPASVLTTRDFPQRTVLVKKALASGFLLWIFAATPFPLRGDFLIVDNLEGLRAHLGSNGVGIRMTPGVYRLDTASSANFLEFSGNDAHYDFTGVTLEVDTALLTEFQEGTNMLMLSGDRLTLDGLSLVTVGNQSAPGGTRAISITGDHVTVRNVSLWLEGSHPYGYGSYLGIGSGSLVPLRKMNGIRMSGLEGRLINCRIFMRSFGHAIFLRGARNTLIQGCYIEGVLRKTDDILAETSGPAFDFNFIQYTGAPIPAGRMASLSEDGIRAYPDDPLTGELTDTVTVENTRVTRMRRGITLANARGEITITGCEITESERVNFHFDSNTTVRDSSGDARFSQLLDIPSNNSRNNDIELMALDSRQYYGNTLLAKINGVDHRIVLREQTQGTIPPAMAIELGTDRGQREGQMEAPKASRVWLWNLTPAAIVLHRLTDSCMIMASQGTVTDLGDQNMPLLPNDCPRSGR